MIGSIYVEVKGDRKQFDADMRTLRSEAKKSGTEVANALNAGISSSTATRGISQLSTSLTQLAKTAQIPRDAFRQTATAIASGLSDVAKQTGMTEKEFARLNERMLRNQAMKTAESSLRSIATSAGLSQRELRSLAIQMGYSSAEAGKMAASVTRTRRSTDGFTTSLKSMATALLPLVTFAAVTRGLQNIATGFLETADRVAKLSQSTGIAVETLSALDHAAKLSGTSLEPVARGLNLLSKNALEASQGTGVARQALDMLGIAVVDTTGKLKNSDAIMLEVADRFAGMQDGAAKTALAMQIFGRSGAEMIPMLNRGSDGIRSMTDEANKLGIAFDLKTAQSAERVNDQMLRLRSSFKGISYQLAAEVLPAISDITDGMLGWVRENDDLIKQNLSSVISGISSSMEAAFTTGKALYPVFKAIGETFQGMVSGFGSLPPIIRELGFVGAFLLGKKGWAALALVSTLSDHFDQMYAQVRKLSGLDGEGWFAEGKIVMPDTKDAAKPLLDFAVALQKAGKEIDNVLKQQESGYARLREELNKILLTEQEQLDLWYAKEFALASAVGGNEDYLRVLKLVYAQRKAMIDLPKDEYVDNWQRQAAEREAASQRAMKAMEDEAKREIALNKERSEARRQMLQEMGGLDAEYFDLRRQAIEDDYERYSEVLGLEELAARWRTEQLTQLFEDQAKASDKFFDGFDAGLDKMLREWKDFNRSAGKIGFEFVETMSKGFADAINSSMSQILIDGFKGELRSFEDYWKRLWGNLLDVVIQAVAQMVAKMALLKIGNLVMGSGGGGGGGLLGAVAGLISIAGGTGSTGLGSTVDLGTSAYGAANKGYEYAGKLYDWYRGVGANAPTGGTGGYMVSGVERGGSSPQSGGSGGGLFTGTGWGTAIVGGVLAGLSAYLKMDDDRYRSEERWTQTIISGVMTTLATKYGGPVMGAFVGWITQLVIGLEDPKTFVNAGPTSAFKTRERYDTQQFDVDGNLIRQRDMDIEALRSGYYDSVENIYKEAIQTHYEIGTSGFSIGIDSIGRGGIFWREFKDDKGAFQEAELGLAEFVAEYYTAFFDVLEEITGGTLAGFVETLGDMFDGKQVENWMFNKGAGEQIGLWTPDGGGEDYIRRMFDDMTMNLVDFNDRLGNYFMEALSGFTESVDWFTGDFLKEIAVSDEDGNAIEEAAQTWLRAADTLSIVPKSVKRINEMIQEGLTAAEAFGRIEAEVNEVRGMVSNAINAAMQESIASGNWDNFGAMVASGIENQILTGIANAAASALINQFMSDAVRMIFNMPMEDLAEALVTGAISMEVFRTSFQDGMAGIASSAQILGEALGIIFESVGSLKTDWGFSAPAAAMPSYTSYTPTAPAVQDRSAEILNKKLALELQIAELMNDQNAVQEITNRQREIELQSLRELNPELATLQERLWGLQDDAARAARELEHADWQQSLDGLSDFDRLMQDTGASMEDVSAIVDWAANTSLEDFEAAIEDTGKTAEYWYDVIGEGNRRLREDAEAFKSFVDQWHGTDSSAIGQLGLSDAELVAVGDYFFALKEGTPEYIEAMDALSDMGISVDELGNAALSARSAIEAWNASMKSLEQQALGLTSDAFQKQQFQQEKDNMFAVSDWLRDVFDLQSMNNQQFLSGLMEVLATEGGVDYFIKELSERTGSLPEDIRDALGPFLNIYSTYLKDTATATKQTQNYSRQMVSYLRTMGDERQEASITDLLNTMNGLTDVLTETQKLDIRDLQNNLTSADIRVPSNYDLQSTIFQGEGLTFEGGRPGQPTGSYYMNTRMPSLENFAEGEEGLRSFFTDFFKTSSLQRGYGSMQDGEFVTTDKFEKWFQDVLNSWSEKDGISGLGLSLEDMYRLGDLMKQIKEVGSFINTDGSFNKENFSEMYDILRDQSPEDLVALYGDDTAKYLQDMIGLWERFGEEGSEVINDLINQFEEWQKRLRNENPIDSFNFGGYSMQEWVDWGKVTDINSFLDIAEAYGVSFEELMGIIDAANERLKAFANLQDKLNNVSILDNFDFGGYSMREWVDWAKVTDADEFQRIAKHYGVSFEELMGIIDAADQRLRANRDKGLGLLSRMAQLEENEEAARLVLLAQREIELAAMDESLRPLQERVWALEDATAAENEAIQGLKAFSESVRNMIDSIRFSNLNVALPTMKAADAQQNYEELKAKAFAEDASIADQQKFLAFAQQYLQLSQDAYKSSDVYQEIYKRVMEDLENLDTRALESIEQLQLSVMEEIQKQDLEWYTKQIELLTGIKSLLVGNHDGGLNLQGYAAGGIISGPLSGYSLPGATFHGTEAIIPLNGKSIPVEMRGSGADDRPLHITIMVGNEEFDAYIDRRADDVRVKAERRGGTMYARRTAA